MTYLTLFKQQLKKEFIISLRDPRQILFACIFFLMIVVFFPLTISVEVKTLREMSPGIIWISLLLSIFLSSERLFQQDYEEGIIEQWILSEFPMSLFIFPKILAHWCMLLFPLLIICPIIGMFLHLNIYEVFILIISLICATPAILCICALATAYCTGGVKQKGVLMSLILLPLVIPIMILGSNILSLAMQQQPIISYLCFLMAGSLFAGGLLPFAIGFIIDFCLSD